MKMNTTTYHRLRLAGLVALAGFGFTATIHAINNGEPDAANRFANVGAIVYIHPEHGVPWQHCSGTLIHERGFLTAAHCTIGLEAAIAQGQLTIDDIYISFSPDHALDPATWLPIRAIYAHPDFSFPVGLIQSDVGLIELDQPVQGIPLAQLAPLGFLDDLRALGLLSRQARTQFLAVGYGAIRLFPGRAYDQNLDAGVRHWTEELFQSLRRNTLQCNQVQSVGLDSGGTCYGDSGGPNFYEVDEDRLLLTSITSWGDTECVSTDMRFRVDTEVARNFIEAVLGLIEAQ